MTDDAETALVDAMRALGLINATCHGGALKRPGDVARKALAGIHATLGSVEYDRLSLATLRDRDGARQRGDAKAAPVPQEKRND